MSNGVSVSLAVVTLSATRRWIFRDGLIRFLRSVATKRIQWLGYENPFPAFKRLIPVIVAIATLLAALSSVAQEVGEKKQWTFNFTGALFGYFRIEANANTETTRLEPVRSFFAKLNADPNRKRPLLLGMGDNFGPEFGAALQYPSAGCNSDNSGSEPERDYYADIPPESLYKTSTNTPLHASCDNVARFLMAAEYDAIVPGREDFMYSAGWLREMALRLKGELQDANKDHKKPLLLAANLRVKFGPKDSRCPLLFGPSGGENASANCTQDGGVATTTALDWLRRLDLVINDKEHATYIRSRTAGDRPSAIDFRMRMQLFFNEGEILGEMRQGLRDGEAKSLKDLIDRIGSFMTELEKTRSTLQFSEKAGKALDELVSSCSENDGPAGDVCTYAKELQRKKNDLKCGGACASVLIEGKPAEAGRQALLRSIAAEQENVGYTLVKHDSTLVIGVVGEGNMQGVSSSNRSLEWEKTSKKNPSQKTLIGDVLVLTPLDTAVAILRAAAVVHTDVQHVVVMAQMSHAEAEELAARLSHLATDLRFSRVDAVLSAADDFYATRTAEVRAYDPGNLVPVLSPSRFYNSRGLETTISSATFEKRSNCLDLNTRCSVLRIERPTPTLTQGGLSTAELFLQQLKILQQLKNLSKPSIEGCEAQGRTATFSTPSDECREAITQFLLRGLQSKSPADVAIIEKRDIFLSTLPHVVEEYSYDDYVMCNPQYARHPDHFKEESEAKKLKADCELRVALDRILWKGDFIERVMMDGKSLKALLTTSEAKAEEDSGLVAVDVYGQSLDTYGVVQKPSSDLSRLSRRPSAFYVPEDPQCTQWPSADLTPSPYCVNGNPIADDGAYWISTSDHLANDELTYKALKSLPNGYHRPGDGQYLTRVIQKSILGGMRDEPGKNIAKESAHQQRSIVHVDVFKAVAGVSLRSPVGGDSRIANDFVGVADSRAQAPHQQEVDFEVLNRMSFESPRSLPRHLFPLGGLLGVQSDLEYDRSVLGNLTGKPVNAAYSINSFQTAPFIAWRLNPCKTSAIDGIGPGCRALPRTFLVLYPIQYQRQIVGNYLFFDHTSDSGELTVSTPAVSSEFGKIGVRRESSGNSWFHPDPGSYMEEGFQYGVQHDILSSITLADHLCSVSASASLTSCFKTAGISIDNTTQINAVSTTSLHAYGLYWDIHLVKGLMKAKDGTGFGVNMSFDSKGDYFIPRSSVKELPTQTRYDVPLSFAVNFPVLRNLALSPTYSTFLYANQVNGRSIVINTFSVNAKWYYARDASVPAVTKQTLFKGPSTQDQTKTAKMK